MSGKNILSGSANTRFLIITTHGYAWIKALRDVVTEVYLATNSEECDQALSSAEVDIILYDDATFGIPATKVIEEIHLQNPRALIAIISDNLSGDYYNEIIEAGAADAMSSSDDTDVMLRHISALVRQSQKNREQAFRTRKLHAINLLSQKLHNAEHPTLMIVDAIELICNYFDVYGVAITIENDDHFQLYAGTRDINNRRRLYDTKINMEAENPLRQVILSKMSLVFPDIMQHPHFKPIPVIQNPKATVVVPIKHGSQVLGSLALFSDDKPYTSADVAVFELLASNFGTAFHSINQQHWREIDAQAMRYVLKAWPDLNGVYKKQEIAEVIHDYVLEIETVKTIGIWFFSLSDVNDAIVYSGLPTLNDSLKNLLSENKLDVILNEFEVGLQPLTFHKSMAQMDALMTLYDVVGSSQITVVPIAGNSFEGMMFVSSHTPQGFSTPDISLIENLARVTANVLERNTLIESIQEERVKLQEQTGRVEGVLRSIDEGIFFVDDSHQVVYCNPQFTELTNISPSQVLDKPFSKLFQFLAMSSPDRQAVYDGLMQASRHMQGEGETIEDAYPIVEITNPPDDRIVVEFMRVDTENEQSGWIGVIGAQGEHALGQMPFQQNAMLQNMLEDMTLPLIELNNTAMTLHRQYEILSPNNFERTLQHLEQHVQDVQSMWGNFVQIYKGETDGIKIRSTTVEPAEFVENLLTTRRMELYRRKIRFDKQVVNALIQVDERQMRQCFINLVEFLSHVSNRGAPIFVSITNQGNQLIFTLQEKTTILLENDLSNIFTPKRGDDVSDDLYPHRLGMYLAKQIVDAHGGQLSILSNRGSGVMIKLHLPLASDEETIIPVIEEEDVSTYKQPTKGLTMTVLESQSLFLSGLYPEIRAHGHEIIVEKRLDDVLLDLKMTKVDIIMLEVDRSNTGLVGQVQRIRAQSEVPIVVFTLPDYEDECLQGLAHGADDYFLVPFNEEMLLAKLYAISKRQELAARTAEPITVGELMIDFSRRRVYLGGKLIDLTTKEYELLRVLVMNRGHVMSHKRLLAKVWGPEYDNETQYLWVNISRLRRKLEPSKDSPRYIQNEPRVGYVFSTDGEE